MHLMIRRQRVVRLLAARVVAAEGVCPDEVLRVLHAKTLWAVVGVGHHVPAAQSIASANAVGGQVTLILDVLEVVGTLIAVLVLHPRDGALTVVSLGIDGGNRSRLFRVFWVEVVGAVVGVHRRVNIFVKAYGIVCPVFAEHGVALPQNVRRSVHLDSALLHE